MQGRVIAICIGPERGKPMQSVSEVEAIAGAGLKGDRYATGTGSFSRGEIGKRQVTLMNAIFFPGSGYEYPDSRRNLFVEGVELMWLVGREFQIGEATFKGVKYCDPCRRPTKLGGDKFQGVQPFNEAFFDRGGLLAEVIQGGTIRVGSVVIPPPKNYKEEEEENEK